MTEINNRLTGYDFTTDKINAAKGQKGNEKPVKTEKTEEDEQPVYAQDNGAYGRSLVKHDIKTTGKKAQDVGGDINDTVNKTIFIATYHPGALRGSEDVFNTLYDRFRSEGSTDDEAYMKALLGEEEFLSMVGEYNK